MRKLRQSLNGINSMVANAKKDFQFFRQVELGHEFKIDEVLQLL